MKQFIIGIDYGTESARGVLVDAESGALVDRARHGYAHGVMTEALTDGTPLPSQWALQDADDYLAAAEDLLGELGQSAREADGEIVGIGIDSTASSPLPARADGVPLSRHHRSEPHAYVKLWKHHSAQSWADEIDASGASILDYYGGQTSCEWLPAKAGQMAAEAPDLWAATERFIEAGDWIVWQLTGVERRSACQAGYKAHWQPNIGYPEITDVVAPGLHSRLKSPTPLGQAAGSLDTAIIERTRLPGRPTVAVAVIDAHAVVPAVGVSKPGTLVATLGTSACHLLVGDEFRQVPGLAAAVPGGIVPGAWGFEAGQASFGDLLNWFVRSFPVGESDDDAFSFYEAQAGRLAPGEAGVLALDWWNGCRTPLMEPRLSGLLVGMTLETRPAAIYRALLDSLCFGTRRIVDTLDGGDLPVAQLVLTSGLAERSPLLNQLLCDVTGLPAHVPAIAESTARGAAIHGAVAAGVYPDFESAVTRLGADRGEDYVPRADAVSVYNDLYTCYRRLSDYFAASDDMETLRHYRSQSPDTAPG